MNNKEFKSKLQQTINAIKQVELELKESPIVIVNNDEQEKIVKDNFLYCNIINANGQLKDDNNTVYIMPYQIYEPKFVTLKDIEDDLKNDSKGVFGTWEL